MSRRGQHLLICTPRYACQNKSILPGRQWLCYNSDKLMLKVRRCRKEPKKRLYDILKKYYQDEEEDMYWGEAQLELIECIGKQNWLIRQL